MDGLLEEVTKRLTIQEKCRKLFRNVSVSPQC